MRHGVKAKHFNRDTKGRKALFKSLLVNLFQHGAVETTEAKAKQIKRLADKLIHRALPGTVQARRVLERFFGSRQVVNNLVDSVAPAMKDRQSGFTRITKLGNRRGDDASMVKLELVNKPVVAETVKEEKAAKPVKEETSEAKAEKKTEAKKTPAKKKTVKKSE